MFDPHEALAEAAVSTKLGKALQAAAYEIAWLSANVRNAEGDEAADRAIKGQLELLHYRVLMVRDH